MELVAQTGFAEGQIASHGVDAGFGRSIHLIDRLLDLVDKGHHIAGIVGIALGQVEAQNKAGGHLRQEAGLFAKLGRTVAFTFENGSGQVLFLVETVQAPFVPQADRAWGCRFNSV